MAPNEFPRFPRFKELPKYIRIRIWTYAASIPRIVELHEHYSTVYQRGKEIHHTSVLSRTRHPALLRACDEAARVALGIYKPIYEHAHSNFGGHSPIYVNPATDIVYRGLETDPLRLFGPNHRTDAVPLGATRTLAVHCRLLSHDRMVKDYRNYQEAHMSPIAEQILACAEHGLEELILVVGNDEDLAEFELEDVDSSCIRARDAMFRANELTTAVFRLWVRRKWVSRIEQRVPPKIKVKRVKTNSEAVPLFRLFESLPQELQNLVWNYASETRRVINIEGTRDFPKVQFSNRHQPPLLSVCRASRSIAMKKLKQIPITTEAKPAYYNENLDVVILPRFDRDTDPFQDWQIKYLGLSYKGMDMHDSYFLRHIKGVRKLIIIAGECHPNSEVTLVTITEPYEIGENGHATFSQIYRDAIAKAHTMRSELEKAAGKWNRYQEKVEEEGGTREPEWIPPMTKAARMITVSHAMSPYSYEVQRPEQ